LARWLIYQARFYDPEMRKGGKTSQGRTILLRAAVFTCITAVWAEFLALEALVVGHGSTFAIHWIGAALIVLAAAIIQRLLVEIAPGERWQSVILLALITIAGVGIWRVFASHV
jgi:hypothetical protein